MLKIFLAGTSFNSRYGGPAFAVSRLALALAEAGADVGLWARDGSALTASTVESHSRMHHFGGSETLALKHFGTPDILHDNGLWLPHNHRLAVLASNYQIPRVVSIRGMLQPWAMNHKKWKKKLAWHLYQRRDLMQAQCHLSTSTAETNTVQCYRLDVPIRLVPNGIDIPDAFTNGILKQEQNREKRKNTALFLGRIHPVKGLPMLIEAWAKVRPKDWVLQIAGPDESGHKAEVDALIQKRHLSSVINFIGPIAKDDKQSIYSSADLFILPTHTENFGMVVGEALAHSVPVLTTKGAPWSTLVEHNCGWWVDISVDGIADGLRQAISCDELTLQRMGVRGYELIKKRFGWEHIAQKSIAIYEEVLSVKPL